MKQNIITVKEKTRLPCEWPHTTMTSYDIISISAFWKIYLCIVCIIYREKPYEQYRLLYHSSCHLLWSIHVSNDSIFFKLAHNILSSINIAKVLFCTVSNCYCRPVICLCSNWSVLQVNDWIMIDRKEKPPYQWMREFTRYVWRTLLSLLYFQLSDHVIDQSKLVLCFFESFHKVVVFSLSWVSAL